jgi:hypothetical protein
MSYKGLFCGFTQPDKYLGDASKVTYRSMWERAVMQWLDTCPAVAKWSSEEVVIPYFDPVQAKGRRYFVDFYIKLQDGREMLIEVKPHKETQQPKEGAKRTRKFIAECQTWATNQAKWDEAKRIADTNGMQFEVWTEHHLQKLGIMKSFLVGDKAMFRAERRAMPNSKYNKVRKTTTVPKRRS